MLRPLAWLFLEGEPPRKRYRKQWTYVLEALAVDGGVEADGVLAGDNVRQGAAGLALSVVAGHLDAIGCASIVVSVKTGQASETMPCCAVQSWARRIESSARAGNPPEFGPHGPRRLAHSL